MPASLTKLIAKKSKCLLISDVWYWLLGIIDYCSCIAVGDGPWATARGRQQAAFLIRKARQSMYRLRNEMQDEIDSTAFSDIDKARQEMADLKNDFKQLGRDLATSAEQTIDLKSEDAVAENSDPSKTNDTSS